MSEFVESRVRRVVAEHLGVGPEELAADVSLVDDLAADSLDLVELAIELEGQFGIVLSESAIDALRTYGDLVDAVELLTGSQRQAEFAAAEATAPPDIVARVIPPPAHAREAQLQRLGLLTPYTAQTIMEDALTAGPGARLELSVPAELGDLVVSRLREQFASLAERGVRVSVMREPATADRRQPARARHHAA